MNEKDLKSILFALNKVIPNINSFFRDNINDQEISSVTINNALKNKTKALSNKTQNFFMQYIEKWDNKESIPSLHADLKEWINKYHSSTSGNWESDLLKECNNDISSSPKYSKIDLTNSSYIGKLQDNNLPFHNLEIQKIFWDKIRRKIIEKNSQQSFNHVINELHPGQRFDLAYIKIAPNKPINNLPLHVTCKLNDDMEPPDADVSLFTAMAMKGPNAHDSPSFGVCGYEFKSGNLYVNLKWTTYFRSLQGHDAFFMSAVYACGSTDETQIIEALSERVNYVLRNKGENTRPILGVTTAVVFRRDEPGDRYWTFVQLKEGGASRIPESHLTPSFVHQPVTRMRRSLCDEVEDIEFHIYRELIEEIFNFPEQMHSDFSVYKKIVYSHFAIESIKELIANKKAELIFDGLAFDIHRAKYELIYVLRIDDSNWFERTSKRIEANYEAIKTGVVLAPLDVNGVFEILNGNLTYGKPYRRMCAPGQAGLIAAVKHLKKCGNRCLENIQICTDEPVKIKPIARNENRRNKH